MIVIYGIKNCDKMKKAFNYFNNLGIGYKFHDYKKEGVDKSKIKFFVELFGIDNVINKKGTTWRNLDEKDKNLMNNKEDLICLIQNNTSLIKRPIIESESNFLIGFNLKDYQRMFEK